MSEEQDLAWHEVVEIGNAQGVECLEKNNLAEALEYFGYAMGSLEQAAATVHLNVALTFAAAEEYDEAIEHLQAVADLGDEQAIEYLQEIADDGGESFDWGNAISTAFELGAMAFGIDSD